eukprot:scaffold174429_cov36-Cyclotella_meneghiniana.AAC.2
MLVKPVLLKFKFDGFADLSTRVDQEVCSDVQTDCNGNKWKLLLYPGGLSRSNLDNGNEQPVGDPDDGSGGCIGLSYVFAIKGADGAIAREYNIDKLLQPGELLRCDEFDKFMERPKILDPNNSILKDGALCVNVTIQGKPDDLYECKFSLADKMRHLLESGKMSDASFKVGDETFKVHSLIIRNNAPILASHLHPPKSRKKSSIVIEGISPEVFKLVLQFVYIGINPSLSLVDNLRHRRPVKRS